MTDGTTRRYNDGEVLSGVQRRRRWTPEEKVRIVEETYLPGMSVSLVARQHGISGSQVFTWRRLMNQGALTAAAAGEEVVPASEYLALEAQVRELQRLLGKKAMENELLREAVSRAAGPKNCCCARPHAQARLCPREPQARRPDRHRAAARLARSLQRGAPPSRAGLSFPSRVHRANPRGPVRPLGGNNNHERP